MKRIICDTCGKQAEPDQYGLAPAGWFSVNRRNPSYVTKDYCSPACAVEGITDMQVKQEEPQ